LSLLQWFASRLVVGLLTGILTCDWSRVTRSQDNARSGGVDTAVDVERGAGDKTVVLAGEKHGGTRNVLRVAAATERYAGHRCLGGLGGRVRVVETGAENHAGCQSVHAHAKRAEFIGEGSCKRENGAFRGRVDQRTG